jgi:hypothetical protein
VAGSGPSDFAYPQQLANDFVINATFNGLPFSTFNEVQWRGGSVTPWTNPDDFTIRIFADNAGTVGVNPLHEFRLKDDLFGNGVVSLSKTYERNNGLYDEYRYNALIPDLTLAYNTTYWLSIVNNTAPGFDNAWLWSSSIITPIYNPSTAVLGSLKYRSTDGQTWLNDYGEHAFSFNYNYVPSPPPLDPPNQPVPEPFTILGVATALGFGSFFKRKVSKKNDQNKV